MKNLHAILTIAYRDVMKFTRDRPRIFASLIFPLVFIGVLGGTLQANIGNAIGFNFLTFIFTGIVAQTLFQSTASGIISLVEDRENDFAQELFITPLSRYTIIFGKILGESIVSFLQVLGVIVFSLIIQVPVTFVQLLWLLPFGGIIALFGGAFGVLVMSQLNSQRAANQIFPFVILPQYFLSGAFAPVTDLPWYLLILSRIAPMTYAVDLARGIYYWGTPEYSKLVIFHPLINLAIMGVLFVIMIAIGTYFIVRSDRNR